MGRKDRESIQTRRKINITRETTALRMITETHWLQREQTTHLLQNSDLPIKGMEDVLCKGITLILRLGVTFVAGGNEGRSLGENLLLLFLANQHKQPEAQADA